MGMILHRRFRTKLPLLVYGDLSSREEAKIKRHLAGCEACGIELKELQRLKTIASAAKGAIVDGRLLSEARSQLNMSVGELQVRGRPVRGEGFLDQVLPIRPGLVFGGGAAVLLAGLLVGRYLIPATGATQNSADPLAESQDVTVSNVRIIESTENAGSGYDRQEIELAYDATRPMRVRGVPGDPRIQRVIAHAIVNGDNPGVRMRAVSSIDRGANGVLDREIKAALLLAMTTDVNDGVRKTALEKLLRHPADREIRDGLLHMLLTDGNPGLRVAAIKGLDSLAARGYEPDARMRKSLTDHLRNEDNLFVRVKTESILKGKIQ
jgi:hypothetical protein